MAIEWPRAFRRPVGEVPEGGLRGFLLLSIPAAYILAPTLCDAGLRSCTALGVLLSFVLMGLAWITRIRLNQGEAMGPLLPAMIVLSLVPQCACPTPGDTIFQRPFLGYAPNGFVLPLLTTLLVVAGLGGVRARWGARLVGMLLVVVCLVLVGSVLLGFPWEAHG